MNKCIKEKWLRALRSGRYAQTNGYLHKEVNGQDRFCCLGVLTNLYVEENGEPEVWNLGNIILAEEVVEWAELTDENPHVVIEGTLASLNDSGRTFKQIANIIEKEL